MSNRKIQKLCKQIEDNKYSLSFEHAISGALDLGKVYYYLQSATGADKALLEKTLTALKENLTPETVQRIWDDINQKDQGNHRELEGYLIPINTLKKEMIKDIFYLNHLSNDSIVDFGKDGEWLRYAMVGLIRKHIAEKGKYDPFAGPDFSYDYLSQDGARNAGTVLTPFIKQCAYFVPLEEVFQLGSDNVEVAKLILNDLTGTLPYFQVSSGFAQYYEELRAPVAKDWQEYFANNAPDTFIRIFLSTELEYLKENYPEFQDVNIDARQQRHAAPPPPPPPQPQNNNQDHLPWGILGAIGAMYIFQRAIGRVAAVAAVRAIVPAAIPGGPVVMFAGLAAGHVAMRYGPQAYDAVRDWMNSGGPQPSPRP